MDKWALPNLVFGQTNAPFQSVQPKRPDSSPVLYYSFFFALKKKKKDFIRSYLICTLLISSKSHIIQWNLITSNDLIICSKAAIFPDLG